MRWATDNGQDLERVRRKAAFERLLARLFSSPNELWLLKGGYAMELRFPVARATRDIDLVVRDRRRVLGQEGKPEQAILYLLREAVADDLGDHFRFAVNDPRRSLEGPIYGGARFPIDARMGSRLFTRFYVDIAIDTAAMQPSERTSQPGYLAAYGFPPVSCLMVNVEQQFAEKFHAYSLPRNSPNGRVKDLIDMVMLVQNDTIDAKRLKEAISSVFDQRDTHPEPVEFPNPPEDWQGRFGLLADECGIALSLDDAVAILANFLATKL